MSLRRLAFLATFSLAVALASGRAAAQLALPPVGPGGGAPAGGNAAGYSTSVPLDLPPARGGLPIPVGIVYTERGMGAAGRGWDVPLSYIRQDTTILRRRPLGTANVAPQGRELVTLMLGGRTLTLVRTANGWSARDDAPELQVQRILQSGLDEWRVYDGGGRTYRFASLTGNGLWLLEDVFGSDGARVHLAYDITTPSVAGAPALAVNLSRVSYNPHPTIANCYKNAVGLGYDAAADPPLAFSSLGSIATVRRTKLITVDVYSKADCSASDVRLREYQLGYQADGDTQQPRLTSVVVLGQAGTPEASMSIPVASYSYGTATTGGALNYTQVAWDPHSTYSVDVMGRTVSGPAARPGLGNGTVTDRMLVDVSGDGRPEFVGFSEGMLLVASNQSTSSLIKFVDNKLFSDNVLSPRALETRTLNPLIDGTTHLAYIRVWRQMIDVNGDGRVDFIDAAEQPGRWVVYLNTPDAANPATIHWLRRSISIGALAQQLASRGMTSDSGYLPLARRARGRYGQGPEGFGPGPLATLTEWEMKDINSDGYPDVVFNSSRAFVKVFPFIAGAVGSVSGDAGGVQSNAGATQVFYSLAPEAGPSNKLEAVFGILGTRLTDGNDEPFSAPVTLRAGDSCGVEMWIPDSTFTEHLECGITDVNGDGIPDRVSGTAVWPGVGAIAGGSYFTPNPLLSLPGPLEIHTNGAANTCPQTGAFGTDQIAALLDLTGDGIPDYVTTQGGQGPTVAIGTGVGFARGVDLGASSLASSVDTCAGDASSIIMGWFDLDGDGKLDYLNRTQIFMLSGGDGRGAPGAGRLVAIGNGNGAMTNLHYRSIKGDAGALHQVPFAEVVLDSIDTTGAQGFGGNLSATRYAYGGAELIFDPARDGFTFPGYRRSVMLQTPVSQPDGVGTILVTDAYAPMSAVDPYGIAAGGTTDAVQRYMLFHRVGRTRDVTVLSGNFGAAALTSPAALLGIDVTNDARRIGAAHYEWNARNVSAAADPAGPEPCTEAVFPYDYAGSTRFAAGHGHYDPCVARGFAYMTSVQSWRGAPGAAPPSAANIETRSEITSIDDFGRVVSARNANDLHRGDDDLCVDTTYAAPTGTNERVLGAVSRRAVSDCGGTLFTVDRWEYDGLALGSVAAGHLTSHTVERRGDTGALLDTIRRFDAVYDGNGNPRTLTMTREDGAQHGNAMTYDAFGLAVLAVSTTASGVPAMQRSLDRDPLTLAVRAATDANGTRYGATFDGFGREILSTVTPPGGTTGALSLTSYLGFTGGDAQGRRIVQTTFPDPVDPATAATATGRTATVFLDELGRARRSELVLGSDYAGVTLIGQRTYDGLGRVVFEADPFPSSQSFGTAYGTTTFFNADGTLSCVVRGNGPQSAIPGRDATQPAATDEAHEIYPTCFQRTYQNNQEVGSVLDASSLLAGSPQSGVTKTSYATAAGRVLARSTWQGQNRLEHASFAYDRLGRMTGMTRYQDPAGPSNPVTSSWRYDSLGQLVELDEPNSSPRFYRYSRWGELIDTSRYPAASPGAPSDPLSGLHVITQYDALGRVIHREEQTSGTTDPETVHDYFYDQGVSIAPQVTPTYMLGRLAQATSLTGAVSFSYDSLGQINARVFTDTDGGIYVEKRAYHGDGTLQSLDLFLPDTGFADERVDYTYDSAGRGRSATYTLAGSSTPLYLADTTDPFGRVREAHYGTLDLQASYDDTGRRSLRNISLKTSGSVLRSMTFSRADPMGRERARTEAWAGIPASLSYSYDALGRLSSAARGNGSLKSFAQQFTYDALGNLLGQAETTAAPGAPTVTLRYLDTDRDRICRVAYTADTATDCNVSYDDVGAITSMPSASGNRKFGYLVDGSVRTIDDDRASAHFRYDALGQVQELEVTAGAAPAILDTRHDRRYGELLAWRDTASGRLLYRRLPGPDGSVFTRPGASGPWTATIGEARGTRFVVRIDNGQFMQESDYWPFGKPIWGGASPLPFSVPSPTTTFYSREQWNDGDYLMAFGLSQLGARIYDPAIGRFISRDPLLVPRTAATSNPYAFASNDPVNRADPSGMLDRPPWHDEDRGGDWGGGDWGGGGGGGGDWGGGEGGDWSSTSGWGQGEGTGLYTPGTISHGSSNRGDGPSYDSNGSAPQAPPSTGGIPTVISAGVFAGYLSGQTLLPLAAPAAPIAGEAGAAAGLGLGLGLGTVGMAAGAGLVLIGVLVPAPPGYVPLRCGDYNSACWDDYIRRTSARAQYELQLLNEQQEAAKAGARTRTATQSRTGSRLNEGRPGITTFYHGTTATDAANILTHGIQPVSVNTRPYTTGSFFTHEASQPLAYIAASQWPVVSRKAISTDVRVVIMIVPNQVLQDLQDFGLVSASFPAGTAMFPLQTVFSPGSFAILNANATFAVGLADP